MAEVRPSWWGYFWHLFFFWLIVPPIVAYFRRASTVLRIFPDRITLARGLFSKCYQDYNPRDIRSIDIDQSFLQRIVGIGDLTISTAATAEGRGADQVHPRSHGRARPDSRPAREPITSCPCSISSFSLSLLLLAGALAAAAADTRPNILYCLADDWAWPHAGVYGDRVVRTPTFDRVAREGIRFNYCFSAAPSCTPSRAAMLTGQYPHRLEEGSCLWGFLPKKFPVYPDLLEKAGYVVGSTRKGWGPGNFRAGGFTRNPAGPDLQGLRRLSEDRAGRKAVLFLVRQPGPPPAL